MNRLAGFGSQQYKCQVLPATLSRAEASLANSDAVMVWSDKVLQVHWSTGSVDKTVRFEHP